MSWMQRLFGKDDSVEDIKACVEAICDIEEEVVAWEVGDVVEYIAPCGSSHTSEIVQVNGDGTYNIYIKELDVEAFDVSIEDIIECDETDD